MPEAELVENLPCGYVTWTTLQKHCAKMRTMNTTPAATCTSHWFLQEEEHRPQAFISRGPPSTRPLQDNHLKNEDCCLLATEFEARFVVELGQRGGVDFPNPALVVGGFQSRGVPAVCLYNVGEEVMCAKAYRHARHRV